MRLSAKGAEMLRRTCKFCHAPPGEICRSLSMDGFVKQPGWEHGVHIGRFPNGTHPSHFPVGKYLTDEEIGMARLLAKLGAAP